MTPQQAQTLVDMFQSAVDNRDADPGGLREARWALLDALLAQGADTTRD